MLGLDFLPRRERDRKQRQEIIGAYERFQGDTGSTEVQGEPGEVGRASMQSFVNRVVGGARMHCTF